MQIKNEVLVENIHRPMKTLGQKLLEAAKTETVKLTDKYWGSEFFKACDHTYWVRHYRQGFGGMKSRDVRVLARDVAACDTIEELAALLKPTNDEAEGDPSTTPRATCRSSGCCRGSDRGRRRARRQLRVQRRFKGSLFR